MEALTEKFVVHPDMPILRKPGAYLIRNLQNGKCYVGISRDIAKRVRQHERGLRGAHRTMLRKAIVKYGANSFEALPLLYSLDSVDWLGGAEAELIVAWGGLTHGYNIQATNGRVGPLPGERRSHERIKSDRGHHQSSGPGPNGIGARRAPVRPSSVEHGRVLYVPDSLDNRWKAIRLFVGRGPTSGSTDTASGTPAHGEPSMTSDAAGSKTTEFLVWWTSEADAKRLGENPDWSSHPDVPDYIRDEFSSRYGRAGRGRLWVPSGVPVSSVTWDDNRPTCRAAADCGGVVFRRSDMEAVVVLPGFITDTAMNEVALCQGPSP